MSIIYRIENFRSIESVDVKKNSYILLFGEEGNFLRDICMSFDYYFKDKKLTKEDKDISDKKLAITDFYTGEKLQQSAFDTVFLESNSIEEELEFGSKTVLYGIVNNFIKEKISIEPSFTTLNAILQDFELEESISKLKNELSRYSKYRLELSFQEFSSADIIKKIDIGFMDEEKAVNQYAVSNIEKLKIKTGIYEQNCNISKDKIFIYYYPENSMNIKEQIELKRFFDEIAKQSIVIIATASKYFIDMDLFDSLNIYQNKKLKNSLKKDELLELYFQNYPILKTKIEIEEEIKFSVCKYISDVMNGFILTNIKQFNQNSVYIENYETIFVLLFYLKQAGIPYKADIKYDDDSVFSNCIKNSLIN